MPEQLSVNDRTKQLHGTPSCQYGQPLPSPFPPWEDRMMNPPPLGGAHTMEALAQE